MHVLSKNVCDIRSKLWLFTVLIDVSYCLRFKYLNGNRLFVNVIHVHSEFWTELQNPSG